MVYQSIFLIYPSFFSLKTTIVAFFNPVKAQHHHSFFPDNEMGADIENW
jgi:hypothetical protein